MWNIWDTILPLEQAGDPPFRAFCCQLQRFRSDFVKWDIHRIMAYNEDEVMPNINWICNIISQWNIWGTILPLEQAGDSPCRGFCRQLQIFRFYYFLRNIADNGNESSRCAISFLSLSSNLKYLRHNITSRLSRGFSVSRILLPITKILIWFCKMGCS